MMYWSAWFSPSAYGSLPGSITFKAGSSPSFGGPKGILTGRVRARGEDLVESPGGGDGVGLGLGCQRSSFVSRLPAERALLEMKLKKVMMSPIPEQHKKERELSSQPTFTQQINTTSAFAWTEHANQVTSANKEGVSVLFSGKVANWGEVHPTLEEAHDAFVMGMPDLSAAECLLAAYMNMGIADMGSEHTDDALAEALRCIASLEGNFAFTLHDRRNRRVIAARDANGGEELWWGCEPESNLLVFSTCADHVEDCHPTAVPFPAGCLYLAETRAAHHSEPGELAWVTAESSENTVGDVHAFVGKNRKMRQVLRVNSRGQLCGAVLRIASVPSFSDISTI